MNVWRLVGNHSWKLNLESSLQMEEQRSKKTGAVCVSSEILTGSHCSIDRWEIWKGQHGIYVQCTWLYISRAFVLPTWIAWNFRGRHYLFAFAVAMPFVLFQFSFCRCSRHIIKRFFDRKHFYCLLMDFFFFYLCIAQNAVFGFVCVCWIFFCFSVRLSCSSEFVWWESDCAATIGQMAWHSLARTAKRNIVVYIRRTINAHKMYGTAHWNSICPCILMRTIFLLKWGKERYIDRGRIKLMKCARPTMMSACSANRNQHQQQKYWKEK